MALAEVGVLAEDLCADRDLFRRELIVPRDPNSATGRYLETEYYSTGLRRITATED